MSVVHATTGQHHGVRRKGGLAGQLRASAAPEADAARLDADFYFPAHVTEILSRLRVDGETGAVIGMRDGLPPVRLFFDATTGLLSRMVRYAQTPVGRNPTQIDFADYREVGRDQDSVSMDAFAPQWPLHDSVAGSEPERAARRREVFRAGWEVMWGGLLFELAPGRMLQGSYEVSLALVGVLPPRLTSNISI